MLRNRHDRLADRDLSLALAVEIVQLRASRCGDKRNQCIELRCAVRTRSIRTRAPAGALNWVQNGNYFLAPKAHALRVGGRNWTSLACSEHCATLNFSGTIRYRVVRVKLGGPSLGRPRGRELTAVLTGLIAGTPDDIIRNSKSQGSRRPVTRLTWRAGTGNAHRQQSKSKQEQTPTLNRRLHRSSSHRFQAKALQNDAAAGVRGNHRKAAR